MNYIEVVIEAAGLDADELVGMLETGEFSGSWEEKGAVHIYWTENAWDDTVKDEIRRTLAYFGPEAAKAKMTVRTVEDRDWNAVWAASLEPIRLGRRIRIRQSWNPTDPEFDGIELVIDPKRAFGTGYHETTQMVVEWLEDTLHGGERILDIGTGSGILSMAAVRLGAASALAVDIDETAIQCAREYASINGFGPELEFRTASFDELAAFEYDALCANIDGRTLPALCPHLPHLLKPNGIACFSGLQHHDYDEIAGAVRKAGFRIYAHRQRGEWLALELVRDDPPKIA